MSSRTNFLTALVIVIVVFGAVGLIIYTQAPYEPSDIAVVVMEPGFDDLSLADQARQGLDRLQGDIAVNYYIPDDLPDTETEAVATLSSLAQEGKYELIIAVGQRMTDPVDEVAGDYPNQDFALIGGAVTADNVASARFDVEQAGFIAGALSAFLASHENYTGIVGILGSVETDPTVQAMISGFTQGLEDANDTYNLNVTLLEPDYIGSYNNTQLARTKTSTMFTSDDASIIFAPVRASIVGVRQGMLDANETFALTDDPRMPLVIGAEGNQDFYGTARPASPVAPSWITTSVVPRTDMAIYDIINATLWGDFPGGETFTYNLTNGGANVTQFEYSSTYISDEIMDVLSDYYTAINEGTIEVIP